LFKGHITDDLVQGVFVDVSHANSTEQVAEGLHEVLCPWRHEFRYWINEVEAVKAQAAS